MSPAWFNRHSKGPAHMATETWSASKGTGPFRKSRAPQMQAFY